MCTVTHTGVISLTFDSFGYMANTCYLDNSIILTDYNGNNYLNRKIATSQQPYISKIDASGRFVVTTRYSLDIYY
jgi:hypothetical protein